MDQMIIYGIGQLGQLFATAALREGITTVPITRATNPAEIFAQFPAPRPVLLATGEPDLQAALESIPRGWGEQVILLQNGLWPNTWQQAGIRKPTVLVFWSAKKEGKALQPGYRSASFGPQSDLIAQLHRQLPIDHIILDDEADLHLELAAKHAFILTINALGLLEDRPIGTWLTDDPQRFEALADEARQLAQLHLAHELDPQALITGVRQATEALSTMNARGRSAPRRLQQALQQADEASLDLPQLQAIADAIA